MKNYAKKIVLSIVSTLLLSAGFVQAAQSFSNFAEITMGDEIQNVEASAQQMVRFCGTKDND